MSCILNPFYPEPAIALHLNWDEGRLNAADNDLLEGHVIIKLKSPVDISQITINLSGLSISRLEGTRHSQSHQFFRVTQQVFPQCAELEAKSSKARTMAAKQHSFPFSLKLSRDSEFLVTPFHDCTGRNFYFESSITKSKDMPPYALGQLPPSTGDRSSNAEILYTLEASVLVDGIFKHVIKKSRQIPFYPTSTTNIASPPSRSIIHRRDISFRCTGKGEHLKSTTAAYDVATELGQEGSLALGQRVPIDVHVTQVDIHGNDLMLNDYQVMLIQKTVTRVGIQSQVQHLFRTLRTVSNLNLDIRLAGKALNTTMTLSDNLWGVLYLPNDIIPSFETCNISRSYKLEVRLGFKGGPEKTQTRILEVQFPINIVANASSDVQHTTSPARKVAHA